MIEGTQAGTAYVRILPDFTEFNKRLDGFGRSLQNTGRALSFHLTLPLAAAAAVSAKLAVDYDTSFRHIQGLTGESKKSIDGYRQSLLDLSPKVNRGPTELADALYFIASAGIHGKTALDVLTVSAKGAQAGLGETKVVADALTSAINAYGTSNLSAAKAGDVLANTVKFGKGEANAFAPALGNLLPTARKLHVSFDQVGASLASITDLGITVPEASTEINALFTSLLKVTPKSSKELAKFHLTQADLLATLKKGGLPAVLNQLQSAFKGNDIALRTVLPNVRAFKGFINLTGDNAKRTTDIFKAMAGRNGVGALNTAFKDAQAGDAAKFHEVLVQLQVAAIRLGQALLPALESTARDVGGLVAWFQRLSPEVRRWAGVIAIAAAASGPFLFVLGSFTRLLRPLIGYFGVIQTALARYTAAQSAAAAAQAAAVVTQETAVVATEAVTAAVVAEQVELEGFSVAMAAATAEAASGQLAIDGLAGSFALGATAQAGLVAEEAAGAVATETLAAATVTAGVAAEGAAASFGIMDVALAAVGGPLGLIVGGLIAVGVAVAVFGTHENALEQQTDRTKAALQRLSDTLNDFDATKAAAQQDKLALATARAGAEAAKLNLADAAKALKDTKASPGSDIYKHLKSQYDQAKAASEQATNDAKVADDRLRSDRARIKADAAKAKAQTADFVAQAQKQALNSSTATLNPFAGAARSPGKHYLSQFKAEIAAAAGGKGQVLAEAFAKNILAINVPKENVLLRHNQELLAKFAREVHRRPTNAEIKLVLSNKDKSATLQSIAKLLIGPIQNRELQDTSKTSGNIVAKAFAEGFGNGLVGPGGVGEIITAQLQAAAANDVAGIVAAAAAGAQYPTPPGTTHKNKKPKKKRAGGGNVSGDSMVLVGETGPELFVPHVSGRVVSNEHLGSAIPTQGGGRAAITITNWGEGTGYMETVADGSVAGAAQLRRQTARMRR